ncbi:MAG: GNAT family N-acetyltransferase [Bacteroidia bacterium]|nr:GNAT family N-acetyltransferase [Bacteroidia bacterium]MCZ2276937.1 GNAT family N-acetyltransferase [Bacteroidia bacterium]
MSYSAIRKIIPDDLSQLQHISRQTFIETFAGVNSAENLKKYLEESFSSERLTAEISNPSSEFYFSLNNLEITGYLKINFGLAQTELQDSGMIEIERIYVLRKLHGSGTGQLLMDKAFEIARKNKITCIWLGVWEKNHRAISFYKKNGFRVFDKHFFKLGEDIQTDILMQRSV